VALPSRRSRLDRLDVVVADLDTALAREVGAGARAETDIRTKSWGRIVGLADRFGHGLRLIQFLGSGYDEIAASEADAPMRSN
jgi:hypothetical protein